MGLNVRLNVGLRFGLNVGLNMGLRVAVLIVGINVRIPRCDARLSTCHKHLCQVNVRLRHSMTTYQKGSGIKVIIPTQIIHVDTCCTRVFIAEYLLSMTDTTSAISLWPISNYCDDSRDLLWAAPCSSFRRAKHFGSHLSNQMCQISEVRKKRIKLIEALFFIELCMRKGQEWKFCCCWMY